MLFGYVKKEDVISLINKEVELTRQTFDKYRRLADANCKHRHEGECCEREAARCEELANEYFARYLEAKELLAQIDKL